MDLPGTTPYELECGRSLPKNKLRPDAKPPIRHAEQAPRKQCGSELPHSGDVQRSSAEAPDSVLYFLVASPLEILALLGVTEPGSE